MPGGLRIAMVAPPWYPLPPRGYGGTELVAHLLHTELTRRGHQVTVFGATGSLRGVTMLADAGWIPDLGSPWSAVREATYLARVYHHLEGQRFDVIHDHVGPAGVLLALHSGIAPVVVHTVHGEIIEPYATFYREVDQRARLCAISVSQATSAKAIRFAAMVHNAVEIPAGTPSRTKERYLIEVARIVSSKGQHLAIEVARRTNRKLILAGKVERTGEGEQYFEDLIEPYLGRTIEYYPNVHGAEKDRLVARAAAGIFPLLWEEPFGLAMAECMVAGTPVVALRTGSAPELIEPGVTGFLAEDVDGLVDAVNRLDEIDTMRCATVARERFSPARMADDYLKVYTEALAVEPEPAEAVEEEEPAIELRAATIGLTSGQTGP